jgi:REDY-like protein HapK
MTVRYVINTLKPGVEPAAYERWLREHDYRIAKTLPSIISYKTFRIEGPIHNAPAGAAWRYIERIEIRDLDQYQKDIASPAGQELIRQLYENYCDRHQTVHFATEPIEE